MMYLCFFEGANYVLLSLNAKAQNYLFCLFICFGHLVVSTWKVSPRSECLHYSYLGEGPLGSTKPVTQSQVVPGLPY